MPESHPEPTFSHSSLPLPSQEPADLPELGQKSWSWASLPWSLFCFPDKATLWAPS